MTDETTSPSEVPQSPSTARTTLGEAEPFDYGTHAPTTAPGTEMPDLGERPPITPPRDNVAEGHAGVEGSAGYDAPADDAGRDPESTESKKAKGKAPEPTPSP